MGAETMTHVPPVITELVQDRPLVFFDLETTGTDTGSDRIVQLHVLQLKPAIEGAAPQEPVSRTTLLDPGMPIPEEATAIHGISDVDVRGAPKFGSIAQKLWAFLDPCDLAGFNIRRFDVPLLMEEFKRVGMEFDPKKEGRRVLDLQFVFHARERRDLAAAALFYTGEVLEAAHSADADTLILPAILAGQMKKYDLSTIDELHAAADEFQPVRTEVERWFGDDPEANPVFQFGKHKGETLKQVCENAAGYLSWMLSQGEISGSVKDFIRRERRALGFGH